MNKAEVQQPRVAKPKRGSRGGSTGSSFDNVELFLLHLPTTIWYLIFCYAPIFGVIIAFKNYTVAPGRNFLYSLFVNSPYTGFANFRFLFKSSFFSVMLRNTLVYNIIFIILGVVIPVTLAIMINQLYSKRLAKVCQTMMFLPHFLSWVVIGYFVYAFLATDAGLFNRVFVSLGIGEPKHQWYGDVPFWRWFLVFLNQWKGMGYGMVVYLASISGIDAELYDAAYVDGANRFQTIWHITVPSLLPTYFVLLLLNVASFLNNGVEQYYVFQNSFNLSKIQVLDLYVYNLGLGNGSYSLATAISIMKSFVSLTLLFSVNALSKALRGDSIL